MRILSRRDVLEVLTLRDCIAAVEEAFRRHAAGASLGPGVLGVPAAGGGFHIKAATIFDSSGTALQDVAAAVVVYERACATGRGTEVKLDD